MSKILIVEDDRSIADMIELFLRKENYQTEKVYDGLKALELWQRFRPDLIVLDIGLPELDGLEVLKQIRQKDNTPCYFLDGSS